MGSHVGFLLHRRESDREMHFLIIFSALVLATVNPINFINRPLRPPRNPPLQPPAGQRCAGRNYNGRRCCTPDVPCGYGEGDCDGPGDGGGNDGHRGCRGNLVCGSNNCLKFGSYYHPKDDCCERPRGSSQRQSVSPVTGPVYSSDSVSVLSQWGSWSSWSSCSTRHQQVGGRCRRTRTRQCQGQGCRSSQDLQEKYCRESSCSHGGYGSYGRYVG